MQSEKRQPDRNVSLYFIALIPHDKLRDQIRSIKERMLTVYGAGHALKSPAHITLQRPFNRSESDETPMSRALLRFASEKKPFKVNLDGFGAFPPRVIYIKITDPGPLKELHSSLKDVLLAELGFTPGEITNDMQPHMTIAARDLTKQSFSEAWPQLQEEDFRASFEVNSIFLLKHNGRHWDILGEFPFRRLE
ncbi:MAG: 2'-5' RNA ligase family protein [Bacteroidales bacterium]